DGRELFIAHQLLDQRAPATDENVRTGALMQNVLRRVPVDRLDQPGTLLKLGGVGAGAGDPAGVAVFGGGQLAVALAGVHQVALLGPDGWPGPHVPVGRRPTVVLTAGAGRLVVLNTFDDSLSVLDPERAAVTRTVPLGPPGTLDFKDRGELLFYD